MVWQRYVQNVSLAEYVVLPNHLQAPISIQGKEPIEILGPLETGSLQNTLAGSLGKVIRLFRSIISKQINKARATSRVPIWQRGYYERIVRDERQLNAVRVYIFDKHHRWYAGSDELDRLLARMALVQPGICRAGRQYVGQ